MDCLLVTLEGKTLCFLLHSCHFYYKPQDLVKAAFALHKNLESLFFSMSQESTVDVSKTEEDIVYSVLKRSTRQHKE
jgi:hypothetical protein